MLNIVLQDTYFLYFALGIILLTTSLGTTFANAFVHIFLKDSKILKCVNQHGLNW